MISSESANHGERWIAGGLSKLKSHIVIRSGWRFQFRRRCLGRALSLHSTLDKLEATILAGGLVLAMPKVRIRRPSATSGSQTLRKTRHFDIFPGQVRGKATASLPAVKARATARTLAVAGSLQS